MNLKFNYIVHILFTISVVLLCSKTGFSQEPNGTANLGILTSFVAFTGAGGVANGVETTFTGDVGTQVGIISGFGAPPAFIGNTYNADSSTAQARYDLMRLYIHINALFVDFPATHAPAFGGGETLIPGVYSIPAAGSIGGNLILDGGGDPNAFFVIKWGGAMTAGAGATVTLTGGTQSSNVFFMANGAISIAANADIKGNLFAKIGAVGIGAGTVLEGRMLTMEGAITTGVGCVISPVPGICTIPIFCESGCTPAPSVDVLGVLSNYALFTSFGAVSNTSTSGINGNIGTNVGASSGYGSSIVIGSFQTANAATAQAKIDIDNAYTALMALPNTVTDHAAAFGIGDTLNAGVYFVNGAGSLGGTMTLDAQNDSAAIFVFKFAGAFGVAAGSKIILANGARRCNVFWIGGAGVATGAVSIGADSDLKGTFLSHGGACTSGAGLFLSGRLLSTGGAAISYAGIIYNSPECVTSTSLGPSVIVAVVDTAAAAAGGTTTALTLNDTYNGAPVVIGTDSGNVVLTAVGSLPAGLTLNTDGTVAIAVGTIVGSYSVTYKICEFSDLTNCSSVTSTIEVSAVALDTDGDGIPDLVDIDDDNDGILDTIEDAGCTPPSLTCDTDGDGIINSLDLDSDNDGINDVDEALLPDLNRDGIADGVIQPDGAIVSPISTLSGLGDKDTDGNKDPYDALNDTTPDGTTPPPGITPIKLGLVSPLTGVVICTTNCDPDGDGILTPVDGLPTTRGDASDTDGDGIPDLVDIDDDNDGILDTVEDAGCTPSALTCDTDGDGIINSLDLDSDNDGINDVDEALLPDLNRDGIADGVIQPDGAIVSPISTLSGLGDKDTDGNKDPYDALNDTTPDGTTPPPGITPIKLGLVNPLTGVVICTTNCDPDGDGILTPVDGLPTTRGDALDTDGDGIPDLVDIDDDNDGILDTVEDAGCTPSSLTCDTDGDGIINSLDLDSDNDGINDVGEALLPDLNRDGIADGVIQPNGAIASPISTLGTLGDKDTDGNKDPYDALNGTTPGGATPPPGITPVKPSLVDPITGTVICTANCDPDGDGILTPVDGLPTTRSDAESVSLLAKVWLQGALYGVNGTNTIMRDNLRSKGLIPLSSPYPGMGLPETIPTPAISAAVLDQATPANDAIVDWVYLELRVCFGI
jgi:hypothetical protein